MRKSEQLVAELSNTVKAGGGIHTSRELAYMMNTPHTPVFTKFLSDCVKKGLVRRITNGIFESTITPADPNTAIYKTIKKLRSNVLSYISLESQLSYTGDISQIIIDRITVITKGRSGIFSTPYGVIEFTHTKKALESLATKLYFDSSIGMYRAIKEQAIADLKDCRRNTHMLEP